MAKLMTQNGVVVETTITTALALGEDCGLQSPMFSRPEEIRNLPMAALLTLLNPAYWWRALLDVAGNAAHADGIKLSAEVATRSGVLEVRYLELRRWVFICRTQSGGERAYWGRLTKGWQVVDEGSGKPLNLAASEEVRREALLGLIQILAVKEEQDAPDSSATVHARRTGYRRAHYRRLDGCGRVGHQAPPAPLPDRRPAYTWIPQVCPATA